jgi:hypothetical protein
MCSSLRERGGQESVQWVNFGEQGRVNSRERQGWILDLWKNPPEKVLLQCHKLIDDRLRKPLARATAVEQQVVETAFCL